MIAHVSQHRSLLPLSKTEREKRVQVHSDLILFVASDVPTSSIS